MKLSVIIVNYNVEYFLEQCLYAVRKAAQHVSCEVFVIDNNSIDGSVPMVKKKFPEVILIENKENLGFSKANNQGLRIAKGEYQLLLNPDTVVEDDTFLKVVDFMDAHPDAGALGVKMVDGAGKFLPESKRGLPTPAAAFYKMFGIASLFKKSKRFSQYHLGYLDENEIHEVEILAGAFMLLRKTVLDEIGLLDETFFMYGEDIDLSYRVIKAGYKNYYFPDTRIIHYKGESTKKSSVNYVLVFYNAMVIFAKKHFTYKNARLFTSLINVAIYFRAFIAILSRMWQKMLMPLIDALVMGGGFILISQIWGQQFIYPDGGNFPLPYFLYVIPSYLFIWLMSINFIGGYDRPIRIRKSITGMLVGTMIILVFYALLPESMRFSRALILLGALWGMLSLPLARLVFYWLGFSWVSLGEKVSKRFLVIGEFQEATRVAELLQSSYVIPDFVGLVSNEDHLTSNPEFIGNLSQVKDIITIYDIDEIVFCSKSVNHQVIIDKMTDWQTSGVDYKIAPEDSLSIIGSNSIHTRGDLYTVDINAVDKMANRRNKRMLDVISSLIFLILYPVALFIVRKPLGFLKNIVLSLLSNRSWVGYYEQKGNEHLPKIRKGILNPVDGMALKNQNEETIRQLNILYARDYNVLKDINIMLFAFRDLGRKSA